MLTGKMPFQGGDKKETYGLIRRGVYSFPEGTRLSMPARQFIAGILQIDPRVICSTTRSSAGGPRRRGRHSRRSATRCG
jgi:hypothetical protein